MTDIIGTAPRSPLVDTFRNLGSSMFGGGESDGVSPVQQEWMRQQARHLGNRNKYTPLLADAWTRGDETAAAQYGTRLGWTPTDVTNMSRWRQSLRPPAAPNGNPMSAPMSPEEIAWAHFGLRLPKSGGMSPAAQPVQPATTPQSFLD